MDFKLPMLGEGSDSGVVVTLHVKEGDSLVKDQPILDLENEKAVASIPSSVVGVVTRIHVKPGDKISVGARILSVSTDGKEEAKSPASESKPAATPSSTAEVASGPVVSAVTAPLPTGIPPAASPSIRKLAGDLGLT